MLLKAVLVVLAAIVLIGWVGSLFGRRTWWSRLLGRVGRGRIDSGRRGPGARFCPSCGRPRIGTGPCPCGRA